MKKPINLASIIYWGCSLLVFFYLVARIFTVSAVMDEVTSFFYYIQCGSMQPYYALPDANNHLLNSLLGHLCYLLLGEGIWVIRLPSLLSFGLYAYIGYQFYRGLQNPFAKFLLIATLLGTQYIIEFFGVCRGYGMSFAFLLGLLYQLKLMFEKYTHKRFLAATFFNILMILANLTLLTWSPIFFFLQLLIFIVKKNDWKNYGLIIGATITYVVIFIYLLGYVLMLKKIGALYLWGGNSFYEVICIGLSTQLGLMNLSWGLGITISLLIIWGVTGVINAKKMGWSEWSILGLFIVFNLGFIALKNLLNVNYPPFRTGIQIYLLLILGSVMFIEKNRIKIINYLSALVGGYLIVFFLISFNFTHVTHWRAESLPPRFAQLVKQLNKNEIVPLTISTHPCESNSWNYLNYLNNNELNQASSSDFPDFSADLIILSERYNGKVPEEFDTLAMNQATQHVLLKRKPKLHNYQEMSIDDFQCRDEYYTIYSIKTDSLDAKQLKIGIQFEFEKKGFLQNTFLVFGDKSMNLQFIRETLTQGSKIRLSIAVSIKLEEPTFKIFVWNPHYANLHFKNIHLYIEKI
jgi:hypothetical protein